MRTACLFLAGAMLSSSACSGAVALDPLAPVPTKVDVDGISDPALRTAWTYSSKDEDGDRETPTHAAAVGEHVIFVAYSDRLDALDLDGEKLWAAHLNGALTFGPVAFRGGVALALEAGWLWLDSSGSAAGFLDLGDTVRDALVVTAGLVVVGNERVQLLTLSPTDSLSIAWTTTLPGGRRLGASPEGEAIYITNEDGSVTALVAATGQVIWRNTEIEVAPLRPAVGQAVYIIDRTGRLHALRRRDGKRLWRGKDIGMRVSGSPAVRDSLVWVPGLDAAVHAFSTRGGSHQFRIRGNGRVHIDLVAWGPWVIASPQYGPWIIVQGPKTRIGPSDPGAARVLNIVSDDDLALPPAVGAAGVVVIDSAGTVRLLAPEQGVIDISETQEPQLQ